MYSYTDYKGTNREIKVFYLTFAKKSMGYTMLRSVCVRRVYQSLDPPDRPWPA